MPSGNPQFGETWVIRDTSGRETPGFIADVNEQIITLVSLTGTRFRVAPARMMMTWRYSRAMHTGNLNLCQREGCANYAFLSYQREEGPAIQVCPRHIPMGVHAAIIDRADQGTTREPLRAFPCPNCSNRDTIEDLRYPTVSRASFHGCIMCSYRWALIDPSGEYATPGLASGSWYVATINTVFGLVRQYMVEPIELRVGGDAWPILCGAGLVQGTRYMETMNASLDDTFAQPAAPSFGIIVRLRGEPTAPRPGPPRPIQRLGGQPSSTMGNSPNTMRAVFDSLYSGRGQALPELSDIVRSSRRPNSSFAELGAPVESEDEHLTPIPENSRWTQRKSGLLLEVVRCERTTDRSLMIVFRALSDVNTAHTYRMLHRDFLRHHRPYEETVLPVRDIPAPNVIVLVGEEWESANGESIIIYSIDAKREMVQVEEPVSKRRRQIGLVEFAGAQWRKVVRKTAYDRLNADDEGSL